MAGVFSIADCLKHDSWAATALYSDGTKKVVCKFNRQQRIFILPMGWLGRSLANREAGFLRRLSGLDGIPQLHSPISSGTAVLANAVAHDYIEGRPLRHGDRVDDEFFPLLRTLLREIHQRGVAYVDLHKIENIIVGLDGRPNLIDFQISYGAAEYPHRWWRRQFILATLQRADNYHLIKHMISFRPDLLPPEQRDIRAHMPWFIAWHRRFIGDPFRKLRRSLLIYLSIRSGSGEANSEVFPEDAVRRDQRDVPMSKNELSPNVGDGRAGQAAAAAG